MIKRDTPLPKINVITSFYLPDDEKRRAELEKALICNIQSEYISKIHLFFDDEKAFDYIIKHIDNRSKLVGIRIGPQPLYSDLFTYANTLAGQLCMIANGDIYLHKITEDKLLHYIYNVPNAIYALTRHEYDLSSPLIDDYKGSHDAFMFKAPIRQGIIKKIQFKQNIWGSENSLIYELGTEGYKFSNPCKKIVIVHEHKDRKENPDGEGEEIREGLYRGWIKDGKKKINVVPPLDLN